MVGVSVVIPLYNREEFIGEAIQSVLDQQFDGTLEVVVSDDGSSDRSVEIAESFGPSVRVLRKPMDCMGQGVSGARNRGIQAATQPYLCFLDSDDFYLPDHLNRIIRHLVEDVDAGFAFCRMYQLSEVEGRKVRTPWSMPVITKMDILYPVVLRSKIIHTNVIAVRKEVFRTVGLFNEAYSNGEDGDMWMRVSEKYGGIFSDHFGAVYRVGHGSEQLTKNPGLMINENSRIIFNEARKRCLDQEVNDDYRIFLIRKILIGIKFYEESRLVYMMVLLSFFFVFPIQSIRYLSHRFELMQFSRK